LMVGNSLRSDIQPLIQLGAHAIYVPYPTTWSHEYNLDEELDRSQFIEVDNIKNIVDEVGRLTR
jgi:putative hydrolase of the HAD superfamily